MVSMWRCACCGVQTSLMMDHLMPCLLLTHEPTCMARSRNCQQMVGEAPPGLCRAVAASLQRPDAAEQRLLWTALRLQRSAPHLMEGPLRTEHSTASIQLHQEAASLYQDLVLHLGRNCVHCHTAIVGQRCKGPRVRSTPGDACTAMSRI